MGDAAPLFIPPVTAARSPKSVASPSDAIVINSIVLRFEGTSWPPALTPLTAFDEVAGYLTLVIESPKSDAFPVVEMVT